MIQAVQTPGVSMIRNGSALFWDCWIHGPKKIWYFSWDILLDWRYTEDLYIYIFWVPKISHNFWIIFQFSPVFTGLKAPNIFHGKDESGEGKEQLLVEESMDPHIVLSLDDDFLAGCLATGWDPLNGPKGYISMVYIPYIPHKKLVLFFLHVCWHWYVN